MGQFHDSVFALLQTFTHGMSIITTDRGRRRRQRRCMSQDEAEHLRKSMSRDKVEVEKAYAADLKRVGTDFAAGDEEARSSLSAILSRFAAVIERLLKGRGTSDDYQVLMNLSNTSRIEAVRTFEQLSGRITQSPPVSLAAKRDPAPGKKTQLAVPRKSRPPIKGKSRKDQFDSPTALSGRPRRPATVEGWVRRKKHGRESSSSKSTKAVTPLLLRQSSRERGLQPAITGLNCLSRPPTTAQFCMPSTTLERRRSVVTFASDSTKLGEIPEHKWAQDTSNMVMRFFPVSYYREPEKQKSRLKKLFRI